MASSSRQAISTIASKISAVSFELNMDVDMSNSVVFITAKNNSSTHLNAVEEIEVAVATIESKWNDRKFNRCTPSKYHYCKTPERFMY